MRKVSAAEANRQFSKLLRAVAAGETVVITSRGKPVAEMKAVESRNDNETEEARARAHREFMAELASRPALNLGKFRREDAYE